MRSFLAICLLALISVHFAIRLTGYVQCVVKAYVIDHRDFAMDCSCAQTEEQQLHSASVTLKLQDVTLLAESPRPIAPGEAAKPSTGWVQHRYPSPAAGAIFRPPC